MAHLIDFAATKDPVSGRWDWFCDFNEVAFNSNGDAATANGAWEEICAVCNAVGVTTFSAERVNEECE